MNTIELLEKSVEKPNLPKLEPGDTVRVSVRISEGEKTRIQPFEGVVIGLRHRGNRGSFTVRKVSYGVGVERIFPFYSPNVEKVEVLRRGEVRRAKLYYLRERSGKAARIRERKFVAETTTEN
ncbi:MAG: 50S ribosomal protein L19 [Deltaproteobacteria bacterium]|nr:50S ribosomal protein L19 [Deltaproteobacteria bacterium]